MPLSDLRVLDLSRYLPGPSAAALLSDFGADVIRVDQPRAAAKRDRAQGIAPEGGERARQRAADLANRNKHSVFIDVFTPEGRETLLRLVAVSDVLVHDYRRATIEAAGLGWDVLRAANPRLICVAVSATGQSGPRADLPGHDPVALALAGVLVRTGEPPRMLGFPPSDLLTGAHAAFAVLVALRERKTSGRGCLIDAAMSDSALALMTSVFSRQLRSGRTPPRGFALGDSGVFETSDGGHVVATNMEPSFWARFCEVVGRPDLADRFDDAENRADLVEELRDIYRGRTRGEWDAVAQAHDLQIAPVLSPAEAIEEPDHYARGALARGEDDQPMPGRFVRIADFDLPPARPAPEPGQHTEKVLAEI